MSEILGKISHFSARISISEHPENLPADFHDINIL